MITVILLIIILGLIGYINQPNKPNVYLLKLENKALKKTIESLVERFGKGE